MSKFDDGFIKRLIAGDDEAGRAFSEFFKKRIRNWIQRRYTSISQDECDDLISHIILSTLESIKKGNYEKSSASCPEAYFFGIVRFKIIDYLKKYKNTKSLEESFNPEIHSKKASILEHEEHGKSLRSIVESLPSKYRHVLLLKYYEKLPVYQISEIVGIPPQKVSERLNYGMKLIKKKLGKKK